MNNFLKICLISIIFFSLGVLYFFQIYLPQKRFLSKIASAEVINIYTTNQDLSGISHDSLIKKSGNIHCDEKNKTPICQDLIKKYSYVMKKIPSYVEYYFCDEGFIIKNLGSGVHYVWIDSPKKVIESGVKINYNSDGWLSYKVNEDVFNDSGARCYPWDNLEDYWKRHGKATPEQIQAVIDKSSTQ